jgi:hypothetical protein
VQKEAQEGQLGPQPAEERGELPEPEEPPGPEEHCLPTEGSRSVPKQPQPAEAGEQPERLPGRPGAAEEPASH